MSIFTQTNNTQIEAPVIEGYGPEVGGLLAAVTESFGDQLAIVQAIHAADSAELTAAKEGTLGSADYEAVYEAAMGNVFAKIKAFFEKLWGKVKSFFAAVRKRFDLIFKDAIGFVTKYEKDLQKLDLDGFKAETYDYTVDKLDTERLSTEAQTIINSTLAFTSKSGPVSKEDIAARRKEIDEGIESLKSEARQKIAGAPADATDAEFSQALFAKFRGGAKGPEDKKEGSVQISKIISEIKDSKKLLKNIEKSAKDADKRYADLVKETDKLAKSVRTTDATGDRKTVDHNINGADTSVKVNARDAAASLLQRISTLVGNVQAVESKVFTAWKGAVEERNREYKGIIGKALRHKAA